MKKFAYLFPGQGAQCVGMGRDFYTAFSDVKEFFELANDVLRLDITKIIFEGPEDLLKETRYAQTAIFLTSLATVRVLEKQLPQVKPAVAAGLSLGEYSALTAAGWLSFEEGLSLVHYRGALMHEACEARAGTMAAVLGLAASEVSRLVEELRLPQDLWVANYNAADQTVISGTVQGIEQGVEAAKARGARRALPLKVHGAFHSGLMAPAEQQLQGRLEAVSWKESGVPVVMNACGERVCDKSLVLNNLKKQITSSVYWEKSVAAMGESDIFLEIGPGKVLAGLNKSNGVSAPTLSLNGLKDLEALAQMVG